MENIVEKGEIAHFIGMGKEHDTCNEVSFNPFSNKKI